MFNFYNQQDYPTGDWNADQSLMNRFSGSWLVDQMIKPYRAITWPFYKDRAFQMVYGVQNQGPESKKYFSRDAARKDYYSLVGGDWTGERGQACIVALMAVHFLYSKETAAG
jgi:hypothetical protein